jgi:hypothetical protein
MLTKFSSWYFLSYFVILHVINYSPKDAVAKANILVPWFLRNPVSSITRAQTHQGLGCKQACGQRAKIGQTRGVNSARLQNKTTYGRVCTPIKESVSTPEVRLALLRLHFPTAAIGLMPAALCQSYRAVKNRTQLEQFLRRHRPSITRRVDSPLCSFCFSYQQRQSDAASSVESIVNFALHQTGA